MVRESGIHPKTFCQILRLTKIGSTVIYGLRACISANFHLVFMWSLTGPEVVLKYRHQTPAIGQDCRQVISRQSGIIKISKK